ncbi:MAG TPA: hypothetical protein VFH38_08025, partial [Jatrophihabitans sp.]|nr:hypothetical protein [Jatrophihabitans sp.]
QRTSWAVWALVGLLGFSSADAGGAGAGAYAAGIDAIACAVTFVLSLHPRLGKKGGSRLDLVLGAVAVAGVVLWRAGPLDTTGAALLAVGCEVMALWPTLRDGWRQPGTESLLSWSADIAGNGLCIAAVGTASVAALAFPVYVLAAAVAMTVVLVARRGRAVTGTRAPAPSAVAAAPSLLPG